MATVSYALTDLAGLKAQLGTDPGDDALLESLIDATTERIERETGRRFAATDHVEWLDGNGEEHLLLDNFPILRVDAVGVGMESRITVAYSGAAVYAAVIVTADNLRLHEMATNGTVTTNDVTLDAATSISEVETAIDAVSNWTATTITDGPSLHLRPGTSGVKVGDTIDLYGPCDWTYPTSIDVDAGMIQLRLATSSGARGFGYDNREAPGAIRRWDAAPYGGQNILVAYRAGYETIPADLDQIAREFAAAMYYRIGQSDDIQSESLGSYSRTLATRTQINDDMRAVLGKYRREVLA